MSSLEMASIKKLSYQRLISSTNGEFEEEEGEEIEERQIERKRSWSRFRRVGGSKRRTSRLRIPGLRRFLRRKAKIISSVRFSWNKVMKTLKESRSHMGDLFAGNYLLMQVSPSTLKSFNNNNKYSFTSHGIPSKYSLDRNQIA